MNDSNSYNFSELAAPFEASELEWLPKVVRKATQGEGHVSLALCYVTARAIMDRLDAVVGPANWRDEFVTGPSGGVLCGLAIRVDGEWVTKYDGSENTDVEPVKGGLSGAFKRAAVKWGIGRYLYDAPSSWYKCEAYEQSGKLRHKRWLEDPRLPDSMMPAGAPAQTQPKSAAPPEALPPIEALRVRLRDLVKVVGKAKANEFIERWLPAQFDGCAEFADIPADKLASMAQKLSQMSQPDRKKMIFEKLKES